MLSDALLLTRLQQGDLEALGLLYDRYRLTVYRTALAITRDEAAADDILQEAFLRLHRAVARVDPARPLPPWLYRVTVNLSYSWLSRFVQWRLSLEDWVERLISPPQFNPEPMAEQTADVAQMHRALEKLPLHQRVVLVLYYLNELSLPEIAEVLNCPVGTVKSRLHYARESLRQQLSPIVARPEVQYEFT